MESALKRRILLVDVDSILLTTWQKDLEKRHYTVITTSSSDEAVKITDTESIDMILMNIDAETGISGIETASLILQKHDIPLIFLSGDTDCENADNVGKVKSYGLVLKNSGIAVLDASIQIAFQLFESIQIDQVKETALRESENKYRCLVQNSPDSIIIYIDRKIVFANEASIALFKASHAGQLIEKPLIELIHPDSREFVEKRISEAAKSNLPLPFVTEKLLCLDGTSVEVEVKAIPIVLDGKRAIQVIIRDLTEQKKVQQALSETEQRFKAIVETSPDGIVISSLDGTIQFLTQQAIDMAGYDSADELLNRNVLEFMHPDYQKKAVYFITEMLNGHLTGSAEYLMVRKDGSQFYSDANANVLCDKSGVPIGIVYVHRDITKRKLADDKIINLLAEKEEILQEVHHRIKSNMMTLTSLLSLQAASLTESAAIAILKDTENRVLCLATLYDRLHQSLDFNELSVLQFLPYLIDEIITSFPNNADVKIIKNIDDFILDVKKLQPLGILLNELLTNIMKYAFAERTDGIISVSASTKNNRVFMEISDNGNGMPDSFDFETSNGFGLLVVKMLTRQLNGIIRLERNEGTRIYLEFERESVIC